MSADEWLNGHFVVKPDGIMVAVLPEGNELYMPTDMWETLFAPVVQDALDSGAEVLSALKSATYRITTDTGEVVERTLADLGWEPYIEQALSI